MYVRKTPQQASSVWFEPHKKHNKNDPLLGEQMAQKFIHMRVSVKK